ncbi:aminotransferase class I/II-fold pyridoxal phosphate-dependent enzyme [Candidatus Poribacteria bacterium]|nr:aminotransferase class I/II-fold pyridoxal phosphate-dependent enzyme [Candidatus Poribacteria bacterium]
MTIPKRLYSHPQTHVMACGYDPQLSEGSVVPPVFRTSTFVFRSCEEGKRAFEIAYGINPAHPGEVSPLIYTRVNNPNAEIVEDRITAWDKTEAAALFSSGMGAISCLCMSFLRPGDSLLFADPVYGGTEYLFRHILPAFGIETRTYPAGAGEDAIRAAAAGLKNLKLIFLETCANPTILLNDIAAARRAADAVSTASNRVRVAVDNTFLGPIFCQPAEHGADLVIYSATKFIGGHSDVVAGFVLGPKDLVGMTKATRTIFGASPDPETAWLIGRSLGTLELRMRTQAESAGRIVEFLQADERVEMVLFPGHPTMNKDQQHIYRRQCSGPGSLISFTVAGGDKEAFCVLDNLRLFHLAVSLGGIESLAEHPYWMTHAEMEPELKERVGITPNLIRLSVGLEDSSDLIDDLRQALTAMDRARAITVAAD